MYFPQIFFLVFLPRVHSFILRHTEFIVGRSNGYHSSGMDSDSPTHITDNAQNDMTLDVIMPHFSSGQAKSELIHTQLQQSRYQAHRQGEHFRQWLCDLASPGYLNMQQTISDQGQTKNHFACTHRPPTISVEATRGHRTAELPINPSGVNNDIEANTNTIDSAAGSTQPSQRLADYSTTLDLFLNTSVGIGSHLNLSSEAHFPRHTFSDEIENTLTIGSTDDFPASQIPRMGFANSFAHLFESSGVTCYCTFCDFVSPSYWSWRAHEREQHLLSDDAIGDIRTEDLKCYFCDFDPANINERAQHIAGHFLFEGLTKDDWDMRKAAAQNSHLS